METEDIYDLRALAIQAAAVGLSVGAVVYHQAMTELIAKGLGLPAHALWVMSVATQLGYGVGLVLALPMGDKWPARRLIPLLMLALGVVLVLQGTVQGLPTMIALCALAGMLSVGGQLLIAHAAKTAPPERRAAIVGTLLSALFGGLLLARFIGGWGGQLIGWRAIYAVVGAGCLLLGLLLPGTLRNASGQVTQPMPSLLRDQLRLWASLPELRRLAYIAACFFAASNGFWANLGSLTASTLHWSAGTTGTLALASVFSIAAPWVVDRLSAIMRWQQVVLLATATMALAALAVLSVGLGLASLMVFVALSDLSVRAIQALTQSRALAIDRPAASRINSLYLTVFFLGAAIGSWLAGILTARWGWDGLFLFLVLAALGGLGFTRSKTRLSEAAEMGPPAK